VSHLEQGVGVILVVSLQKDRAGEEEKEDKAVGYHCGLTRRSDSVRVILPTYKDCHLAEFARDLPGSQTHSDRACQM